MYRIILFLLFTNSLFSQQDYFVVDQIFLVGNKKTKDKIILRELEFQVGDTISLKHAKDIFQASQDNIFRTKLFFEVGINWKENKGENSVIVTVVEAWYIYPAPIFELADRNFNIWWKEMNASLSRVNYGLRLDHLNTTGNRDKLKLKIQAGYTYKYELKYSFPYINKNETWGTSFNILWSRQKEIGYTTQENKVLFFDSENFLYNRFRVSTDWIYRPRYLQSHSFKVEFYSNNIDEVIQENYNPDFYHDQKTDLKWFVLQYEWDFNRLNHFNYPTDGWKANITLRKEGLGILNEVDLLNLSAVIEKYYDLNSERWSVGLKAKGRKIITNGNPGYYHYTALGYGGDQLRGYELFVVDGLNYGYLKGSMSYLFFNKKKQLGKWMFLNQFKHFSIKAYLSLSLDAGYVQSPYFNEKNALNNTYLTGGGPGIHVIVYNYFLMRIEYSINRQGEKGLFLHYKASF